MLDRFTFIKSEEQTPTWLLEQSRTANLASVLVFQTIRIKSILYSKVSRFIELHLKV